MKTNKQNLLPTKEVLKRKHFLKIEIKRLLMKSILQNNQCVQKLKKRMILSKLSLLIKNRSRISRQQNCCMLSGKSKSTYRLSFLARQIFKQHIDLGMIQNIKRSN